MKSERHRSCMGYKRRGSITKPVRPTNPCLCKTTMWKKLRPIKNSFPRSKHLNTVYLGFSQMSTSYQDCGTVPVVGARTPQACAAKSTSEPSKGADARKALKRVATSPEA